MGSIKLVLKETQTLTDGTHPITIRVIVNRKRSVTTLGMRCKVSDWNVATNLPKNRRMAIICQKKLLEMEELMIEGIEQNWSAKKIVNIFSGKDSNEFMFFEYFSKIKLDNKQGISTTLQDNTKIKKFKTFLNGDDISLNDITYKLLREYKDSLEEKGLKSATRYLSVIRQVYNHAIDVEDYSPKKNPFKSMLFKKNIKTHSTLQRNLSIVDTYKMLMYEQEQDKWKVTYKTMAIDFWQFCFLMRGINLVELALMKKEDVKGDYFIFTRQKLINKTTRKQHIKIYPEARKIIDKYIDNNTEYVFPILDHGFDKETSVKYYKKYNHKVSTINANLRRIGERELKLNFNLTTMSARYTFINIAKVSDVPFLYMQELMGHKNMSTTDIYLDAFPQDKIDEYHRTVIDKVLNYKKHK